MLWSVLAEPWTRLWFWPRRLDLYIDSLHRSSDAGIGHDHGQGRTHGEIHRIDSTIWSGIYYRLD